MKAEKSKYYPSIKFSALTNTENVANARRNYLTWIIIVTVLFCVSVASLSYAILVNSNNVNDQTQSLLNRSTFITHNSKGSILKSYHPVPLLAKFRKRIEKESLELTCGESQTQEAIPLVYIEKIFQNDFENVCDYISADLFLYYDSIINKYSASALKKIFNEYQLKLLQVKQWEDFENFLMDLDSNKFKFYVAFLKERNYNLNLEYFENYFALTDELNHWYNFLDRFRKFLFSYERKKIKKYFITFTEKNFGKFTEEIQKRLFPFVYPFKVSEKKLHEINKLINECAQPLKTDFYNCTITFYNRVILLSDLSEKILDRNVSCMRNVYIFASNTIYLDEDLNLFGVNLAIIAPKWVFLKKIKINLDGTAGKNHENGTSNLFQPGVPGNPGGNSGDFLAAGNPHEKFLLISANGGKGGNGQNGSKGRDGVDNTRPGPPVSKPVCLTRVQTFNNSFGEVITQYKIYSEIGCGGSGADGGVGGVGGAGGIITLIGKNSIKVTKGLDGTNGISGKGGAGGIGGRNGCFYEVLDVDNEILHPVTRVKCPPGNILPSGKFGKNNFNSRGQTFPPAKVNLEVHKCLLQFVRFAGEHFVKYGDPGVILLLKEISEQDESNEINLTDVVAEYKILEGFNRFEFYTIFIEKINRLEHSKGVQPALTYMKSIVLGKLLLLKENVDFLIIDLKNHLNVLKGNINTSEYSGKMGFVSYFKKKVGMKTESIKVNLKRIKAKLSALGLISEGYNECVRSSQIKYSVEALVKKRILCITITTIDVVDFLMNRFSNSSNPRLTDLTEICPIDLTVETEKKFLNKSSVANAEKTLLRVLENFTNVTGQEVRERLIKLRDALCLLKAPDVPFDEGRNLLEAVTDELDHFIALYSFIEWERLENDFSKSLDNISLNKRSNLEENEDIKFLKRQLVDVVIDVQYKLAMDVASQTLNPFMNKSQFFPKEAIPDDVLARANLLQRYANQDVDFFCENRLKAVFDKDSAIGEFYFWPNEEIKNELKNLFRGAGIKLRVNLINHHVLNKNFIQFLNVKLEFECLGSENVSDKHLRDILSNFKIEMTHSGYSYYNWKGKTEIVVSEEVHLDYSFRMRGNEEPEIYNALFKKFQNAEIRLSPFTIWTVRLLPINSDADFARLMPFAGRVNLRLTGIGTYIS